MSFMYRMRPAPVVRRPLAFSAQLNCLIRLFGYPHEEQVAFWMWKETLPHLRQVVCDLLCRFPNEVVPFVYRFVWASYWFQTTVSFWLHLQRLRAASGTYHCGLFPECSVMR